jgi:hypothetical protein
MSAEPVPPAPEPVPPAPAPSPPSDPESAFALAPGPGPHPLTRRAVWAPLVALLALLNVPFLHYALRGDAPVSASVPFEDDFERENGSPGGAYSATGAAWRIASGWLHSPGAKNNPLWIGARLPRDVVVEFDARTDGNGDIKCEIFGNGRDHASGYVLVFGGWSNTVSVIARLDEHGKDRKERKDRPVEKGRTYRFRVERKGTRLDWSIDGEPFMTFDDPAPLEGPGHDRFALSSWANDVFFDRLVIRPL